jgi:hypothetical protein
LLEQGGRGTGDRGSHGEGRSGEVRGGEVLYLSRADVEKVDLPMVEIIAAMEEVFREKGAGQTEMPPKI